MTNEQAMSRALELARRGQGRVSPNPLVGCVIIKNNSIVAEGWHQSFGSEHAEAAALRAAHQSVSNATLVCNLEPCSHVGRNPACADLIIEAGISRVIVGCSDPNPLVSGQGIAKLRAAGIEVVEDVLNEQCLRINRFFRHSIVHRRPYILLKVAQTLDGSLIPSASSQRWISSEQSRHSVHTLRAECDAVLIGSDTACADNPLLTVRLVRGEQPLRLVVDSALRCPTHLELFNDEFRNKTIVLCSKEHALSSKADELRHQGVEVLGCKTGVEGHIDLSDTFSALYELKGVQSILIEAGPQLSTVVIQQQLCNELHVFIAPHLGGQGPHAFQDRTISLNRVVDPTLANPSRFVLYSAEQCGPDLHMIHLPTM